MVNHADLEREKFQKKTGDDYVNQFGLLVSRIAEYIRNGAMRKKKFGGVNLFTSYMMGYHDWMHVAQL